MLRGIPTYPAHVEWETVTPTGAALIRVLAGEFGPLPAMAPSGQGFGAGEEREGPVPNLLRALLGSPVPALEGDTVTDIETNLDDMNPEHLPYLLEELLADGALDASLSPLSMKKGRPGQLLRVIARPQDRERLVQRILTESSSIGVRYQEMSRLKLPRELRVVPTPFGPVPVKRTRTPDGRTLTTPEYEACSRLAREHGVPLKRIYQAAERAAEEEPD